ncbi:MAG: KpsF/GutQ family sugar-phosphate isomerase [Hyphomonadaceae bacterium]
MASKPDISEPLTVPEATASHEVGRRIIDLEAKALQALSGSLGATFNTVIDTLLVLEGCLIVSGMGKSGHIGRKIAATLSSTGTPAIYIHPAEASHGDLGMVGPKDAVLALSRSGETSELGDLLAHTGQLGIPLLAITSKAGSTLARTADHALILPDMDEACPVTSAPTTSTTMMLALGDAIAVTLLERKSFTQEDFKRFHPGGNLGAMLSTVGDLMRTGDALPLVPIGTEMSKALEIMGQKQLGCLGVLAADGTLAGMITDGDVRRIVANNKIFAYIDEAMKPDPYILSSDMRARHAVAALNEREISQAFILQKRRPIGIVHMHDFLRAQIS